MAALCAEGRDGWTLGLEAMGETRTLGLTEQVDGAISAGDDSAHLFPSFVEAWVEEEGEAASSSSSVFGSA